MFPEGSVNVDFISGLQLECVNGTTIKVKSGACCLQSSGNLIELASDQNITDNTAYNTQMPTLVDVYMGVDSSGVPVFDLVAVLTAVINNQVPPAPYRGTARSKYGDTAKRYIGCYVKNTSNGILNFTRIENDILYRQDTTLAPFRIVNGNQFGTTPNSVNVGNMVAYKCKAAYVRVDNEATYGWVCLGTPDQAGVKQFVRTQCTDNMKILLNASPNSTDNYFNMWYNATPQGSAFCFIDLVGYVDER